MRCRISASSTSNSDQPEKVWRIPAREGRRRVILSSRGHSECNRDDGRDDGPGRGAVRAAHLRAATAFLFGSASRDRVSFAAPRLHCNCTGRACSIREGRAEPPVVAGGADRLRGAAAAVHALENGLPREALEGSINAAPRRRALDAPAAR